MNRDNLQFTVTEQNCLTLVCQMMATAVYRLKTNPEEAPSVNEELYNIVESFPSVNWGHLYDKFHQQGMNR